jgi:hypothetical protein
MMMTRTLLRVATCFLLFTHSLIGRQGMVNILLIHETCKKNMRIYATAKDNSGSKNQKTKLQPVVVWMKGVKEVFNDCVVVPRTNND